MVSPVLRPTTPESDNEDTTTIPPYTRTSCSVLSQAPSLGHTQSHEAGGLKPVPQPTPPHSQSTVQTSSFTGSTVYDNVMNMLTAESWSAPTYSAADSFDKFIPRLDPEIEEEPTAIHDHVAEAMSDIMTVEQKYHLEHAKSGLERFLAEDSCVDPWSGDIRRAPGIICIFCGSVFTGENRRSNVTTHVRQRHLSRQGESKSFVPSTSLAFRKKCSNGPDLSISQHSLKLNTMDRFRMPKPIGSSVRQDIDFYAIGAWACSYTKAFALRIRSLSARPVNKVPQVPLVTRDNPFVSHDQIAFILRMLDPRVNPRRVNDFFNGLDSVIINLQERFPTDSGVKGLRAAFTQLENLYDLNYGHACLRPDNEVARAPLAKKEICTREIQNMNGDSTILRERASHETKISSCRPGLNISLNPESGGNYNEGEAIVSERRKKRSKNSKNVRKLACHIRKYHEIHETGTTCHFAGADHMWGICQHLNGVQHRQELPFLAQCRICKEFTTVQSEYQSLHGSGICQQTPQSRGTKVAGSWLKLYELLYPNSDRIPSPYVDDSSWSFKPRAADAITELGTNFEDAATPPTINNTPDVMSFLETGPPIFGENLASSVDNANVMPQSPPSQINVTTGWAMIYESFAQFVVQESDLLDHFMGRHMQNLPTMTQRQRDEFGDGFRRFLQARAPGTELQRPIDSERAHLSGNQPPDHTLSIRPEDGMWLGQYPIPWEFGFVDMLDEPFSLEHPFTTGQIYDQGSPNEFATVTPATNPDRFFYPEVDLGQPSLSVTGLNVGDMQRQEVPT